MSSYVWAMGEVQRLEAEVERLRDKPSAPLERRGGMGVPEHDVPPLTAWRCPECGQLHREFDGECMYECGAELQEVEVVPAGGVVRLQRALDEGQR